MKTNLKHLLFLLVVLFTAQAEAQNVYNGKVRDKAGLPVSGATVRGKGLMNSTTTNMDGSFSLETTLPIKKIEASYPGKRITTASIRSKGEVIDITLKNPSWFVSYKPNHYRLFVNAQMAMLETGHELGPSLGLMVGYVKNWGVYGRFTYGSTPSIVGEIPTTYYNGNHYYNTKFFNTYSSRYSGSLSRKDGYSCFAGGGMRRIVRTLHLYAGIAYQNYTAAYERYDGGWYKYLEDSFSGVAFDGGLMLHIGHVAINGGITYGEKGCGHFGIGYAF